MSQNLANVSFFKGDVTVSSYVETYKFVVAIEIRLRAGKPINLSSIPGKKPETFFSSEKFPGGQPTYCSVGTRTSLFLWLGQRAGTVKLTTHLHLLSRLRMSGFLPPLTHVPT
jgi:hypothetical protein